MKYFRANFCKNLPGLRKFKGKKILEVSGLEPRVDSPSWSLMAWIKLDKGKGAQILRQVCSVVQCVFVLQHVAACWIRARVDS